MSLKEQLSALKADNIAKFPEEIGTILLNDAKILSESDLVEGAPKVGEKLKDFTLPNHLGEARSLASLRKNGPVVVTFYRGGWCPYCSLELHAYQEVLQDINATGATLVAITPELPDASLTTSERHNLEFEVLTDLNSNYARELGIVFTLPEELRPIYESFGIEIEKHNGKGQFDLPLAATFVVDVDGTITSAFVDTDYTLRAEPADVVKELEALMK
ncbi:MAG: AhpC/TSA family protein [Proteobacteria bacterium]|nr:AhpC/TSA family protein [Pseudomonadota bacterium]MBU1057344.1 AhpC/TSA family protein [Pseudomonadota bacterium]